jgi:hypothetical protein
VVNGLKQIFGAHSAAFCLFLWPHLGLAETDQVLLFVTKPVVETGEVIETKVTRADLLKLPQNGFETTTIWTKGMQHFEGVWLSDFLEAHDIADGVIEIEAINDYWIEIPVDEVQHGGALLALRRNGGPMHARDLGPVWLVYNYDANPDFRTETIYSRSVWQLDRITVSR